MKCRKNVRKLIQECNAAPPAAKRSTAPLKFPDAVVALKAVPSGVVAPHTKLNRYDNYVYIHRQSMAAHPSQVPGIEGAHPGHRGPMLFHCTPEFLRKFENDLRSVSGVPSICLPYWDWSSDQQPADYGHPFTNDFLGGNSSGADIAVQAGVFASASG